MEKCRDVQWRASIARIEKEKKCTYLLAASCGASLQKCFVPLQNNVFPRPSLTRVIARANRLGGFCAERGKRWSLRSLPWQESCDQLRQTCRNSMRDGCDSLLKARANRWISILIFGRMDREWEDSFSGWKPTATMKLQTTASAIRNDTSEISRPIRTYARIDLCDANARTHTGTHAPSSHIRI